MSNSSNVFEVWLRISVFCLQRVKWQCVLLHINNQTQLTFKYFGRVWRFALKFIDTDCSFDCSKRKNSFWLFKTPYILSITLNWKKSSLISNYAALHKTCLITGCLLFKYNKGFKWSGKQDFKAIWFVYLITPKKNDNDNDKKDTWSHWSSAHDPRNF